MSFPKITNFGNFICWIFTTVALLIFGIVFLIKYPEDQKLGLAIISAFLMSLGGLFYLDVIFEVKEEHKKFGHVISSIGAIGLFFFLFLSR